jgi:hypothetical protein
MGDKCMNPFKTIDLEAKSEFSQPIAATCSNALQLIAIASIISARQRPVQNRPSPESAHISGNTSILQLAY